jgi:uncharacterized protein YcbK (DUF882 family)
MNEVPLNFNRRAFVKNSALVLAGMVLPSSLVQWSEWLSAKPKNRLIVHPSIDEVSSIPVKSILKPESKILSFYNTHTGEWLKNCAFMVNGRIDKQAMQAIQNLFRDHRSGTAHTIDLKLLNILHKVQKKLETKKVYHLISGYRCRASNEQLHAQSNGVAKESMHTKGRAADVFLEHIDLRRIQKAALALKQGGVGRYSQFVHLDSGRFRRWGLPV